MKFKFLLLTFLLLFSKNTFARLVYIEHDNIKRYFIVHTPDGWNGEQLPMIINLHGFLMTMDAQRDYSEMDKLSDTAKCIVIYPQGIDRRWNSGTFFGVSSSIDDVGFLSKLIDFGIANLHADASKIYFTGYSAGGFMCYKLACELTSKLSAIGPVVGSMVYENYNSCTPSRPIPMMIFNGNEDPVTSYGGIPGNFPSIPLVVSFWRSQFNCIDEDTTIIQMPNIDLNDGCKIERYVFEGCDAPIIFNKVVKGGHTWTGTSQVLPVGNTNKDLHANNEFWNFFKNYEIPANIYCDSVTGLKIQKNGNNYQLSWDQQPSADFYHVMLFDTLIHRFDSLTTNSFSIDLPEGDYTFSVGTQCASGHANWTFRRGVNVSTAISNNISEIKIYPNPVVDKISIKNFEGMNFKISNLLGDIVLENTIANNTIDVSSLPSGSYYMMILDKSKYVQSRFIKQ